MSRLLLLLLLAVPVSAQSVSATVDRTQIELLGVVNVRVKANGGSVQVPDLEGAGWQLVGKSSFQSPGGTQLTLRLQAVRSGTLMIGAFRMRTRTGVVQESTPLRVKVGDPGAAASSKSGGPATAKDEQAWIEWDVDRATVWLGEEVRARLYVFVDPRIRLSNVDTSDLDLKGWWTEHTGQRRRANRTVTINGVAYNRMELGFYHLFPLRAGALELPAVKVKLRQSRGVFDRGRGVAVNRTADPLLITVRPLPGQAPVGFAGPAVGVIKLTASVDRTRISGDEGVQLTVETRVRGGRIESTPEITLPPLPGFRVFPPTMDSKSEVTRGQTRGFRRQRWLLRPKKGGQVVIPALRLPHFDPKRGKYRTVRTSPIRITVKGRPSARASSTKSGTASAKKPMALRTVRKEVDLDQRDQPFHLSVWFLFAFFLPPLGLVGLVARDRALSHLGATAGGRSARKAAGVAGAQLAKVPRDPKVAYSAIAKVLLEFLEARFEQTFRGLTHGQLGTALGARGVSAETVRDLVAELENCDFARFAPAADAGAVDAAAARASAIVSQIEAAS